MLSKNFPLYESGLMFKLFEAQDEQLTEFNASLESALNQFFIDLADITLSKWEKEMGLPIIVTKTLEDRRTTIKGRLRGYGTVTISMLKQLSQAFQYGEIDVIEKQATYEFDVKFTSTIGRPPNLEDLKGLIEKVKPAHLGVNYLIPSITWDELDAMGKTWDEIDALNMTWDQRDQRDSWLP